MYIFGKCILWCGGCLVWWMSDVVDVWCGGCPVWWMSGVVDVLFYTWCGGCPVWWMSGVVDVWCGGCLILHTVWWMSGVVDVCVVDVVQSSNGDLKYPRIYITTYFCLLMEGWKVQGICRFPCLQTLLEKAGKGWKVKAHQFWSASYKSTDGLKAKWSRERFKRQL